MFWPIVFILSAAAWAIYTSFGEVPNDCRGCGEVRPRKHLINGRCAPDCWTRQALIDGRSA